MSRRINDLNIELRKYQFDNNELPTSSYKDLGPRYGEFIPFILAGLGGIQEHKQLNWLNLYTYNKLEKLPEQIVNTLRSNPELINQTIIQLQIQLTELYEKITKIETQLDTYFTKIGLELDNI